MQKNIKIIWIDLDEVLAELINFTIKKNNYQINWIPITRKDITDYYIHNIKKFNIDLEYAIWWFRNHFDSNFEIKRVYWAKQKLKEFQKKWYILKIITARSEDIWWDYTKQWLNKYYWDINFSDIIFVNHFTEKHREKSEICIECNINIIIEDNPYYALELAEKWIKVFLLDKPWNKKYKKHKNIIKVKSWKEINI
jgi:hypothetical protein